MDRQELMNLVSSLRASIENPEARDGIIDQISDGINGICDSNDNLTTSNTEYIRNNEQLRAANMKLFMQIGSEPIKPNPKPEDKPAEKLTFEALFNEKGELK